VRCKKASEKCGSWKDAVKIDFSNIYCEETIGSGPEKAF
jgi:hypothetical protein